MLPGKAGSAGASYLNSLKLSIPSHASTDIEYDLAESSSHGNFNETGVGNVSCKGEGLGSRTACSSDGKIPVCSLSDDLRHSREGLYVIEDRRRIEEAVLSCAWRLYSREASLSFDAGCKCRTFSADEGACSLCNMDSERFT